MGRIVTDIGTTDDDGMSGFYSLDGPSHYGIGHFFVMLVGIFVLMGIGAFIPRQSAATLIRNTLEYRCVASAIGREPRLRWSSVQPWAFRARSSLVVGTLSERPGMTCIEDGDAVSFAMLPAGRNDALSLVRIKGGEVRAVFRQGAAWADVTDATGMERWRNEGDGYRKISP